MSAPTVLLTDRAWPDDSVERSIIEGAGLRLVAGPPGTLDGGDVERLVAAHRPAAVLTCWAQVTGAAIAANPELRIVARMGVGLDNIDVGAATRHGVVVTNVPDYCVEEVSDHAVGMVLAWTRGLATADRSIRAGVWDPAGAKLRRLGSLTAGIVGYGRIGRATAGKLAAFGTQVLATTPSPPSEPGPVRFVSLEELLVSSHIVILHAPLNDATRGLIGAAELALVQPGGLLVNVSRGGLIDTAAVIEALASGRLSGAALDVLDTEPDVPAALIAQEGVLVTPHVAFSSDVSVEQLRASAAEEVVRVLSGDPPRHPCNEPAPPVLAPVAPVAP